MTQDTNDPVPSVIGEHYVVERELGRGGMATVYLCTDTRDGSRVAIKILRQELGSPVVIARFLREIAYASELDHPRIPRVLDSGVIGELPYYVMTYVEGESLRRRMDREKQIPIKDAVQIACEAINATSYAHERGIVHRDIKPDNIIVGEKGVFVLDFGIARAIVESGADRLTSTGVGVGTPAYMSPEQALGDRNLDARSDIYSLGCVLYEMVAGIPPFVGPTAQVIISRRFAASAPPLREVRDGVPEWLEEAIARALAKAPSDRWQTADDFAKALNAPHEARAKSGPWQSIQWDRPMTRIVSAVVALAIIAAGLVAWSMSRRNAYENGRQALSAWDFNTAETELRRAAKSNPADPITNLWLAQTLMLKGEPQALWKRYVRPASDHRTELPALDQKRVDALVAFGAGRFGDACQRFGELAALERTRDPAAFFATLGLADCLTQDKAIVPDSSSPSRYAFRASFQRSDSLYEALLDRHPTAAAYAALMPRLQKVLPIDKRRLRGGTLTGPTPQVFYSLPSLVDDTLAYVPYPPEAASGLWTTRDPRGLTAAVSRNGQRLRGLAIEWSRVAPDDPDAHEALARILEWSGEFDRTDPSAMQQLGIARRLAASRADDVDSRYVRQLRLGSDQAGLYVRLGKFASAGALADTILRWRRPAALDSADGVLLLSVAALRGRPSSVTDVERRFSAHWQIRLPPGDITLPPALAVDEMALTNYAQFGGPRDSVLAIAQRVTTNINALYAPEQVEPLRVAILRDNLAIAAPVIGAEPVVELGPSGDWFIRALTATTRHDRKTARNLLDSLAKLRSPNAPSEISMDAVFREAWLRAALGDTAAATRQLDNALGGLPAAPSSALRNSLLTTSLVRVMALRAELAGRAKQPALAKRWADAVFDLWGNGDPIVASTLESVRPFR